MADPLKNAITLIVGVGFLSRSAATYDVLGALKSGVTVRDAAKALMAKAPPGMASLATALTDEARAVLDGFGRDLPPDAAVLFEQMVECALPDPKQIVAARMDAGQVVQSMLARHKDGEHTRPRMPELFRAICEPAFDRLLQDKSFAEDLTPAFMAGVLDDLDQQRRLLEELVSQHGSLARALEALEDARRDQLEAIASRFEIDRAYILTERQLREVLAKKAEEYRDYRVVIDGLDERVAAIANLKGAAQDAAERLDFHAVEELLARVDAVETEIAAETKEARARNALLRGRVEDAYRLLCAAADSFGSVDPLEPARRRNDYSLPLSEHGVRHGSEGLRLSADLLRPILSDQRLSPDSDLWTFVRTNYALSLWQIGARTNDDGGDQLLAEAEQAIREVLKNNSETAYPKTRARNSVNLGLVLMERGKRKPLFSEDGVELLAAAVQEFRSALILFDHRDNPEEWAKAQNSLGIALREIGRRAFSPERLVEAVEVYRAAQSVANEADHPELWAMIQNNLSTAMMEQGRSVGGATGAGLLAQAIAVLRDVQRVYTETEHPVAWAVLNRNLAISELELAKISAPAIDEMRPHLVTALEHAEAAMRVFNQQHTPNDFKKAKELCDDISARLAAVDST